MENNIFTQPQRLDIYPPMWDVKMDGTWCEMLFQTKCPNSTTLFLGLFFTGRGAVVLTFFTAILLLLFRRFGPQEVDTRKEELQQRWEEHSDRWTRTSKKGVLGSIGKTAFLLPPPEEGEEEVEGIRMIEPVVGARFGMEKRMMIEPKGRDDAAEDETTTTPPTGSAAADGGYVQQRRGGVARETLYVSTSTGPTRVTIVGDRSSPAVPLVTLHGTFHNHRTAYGRLTQVLTDPATGLSAHCIFHIDTPGHEEDATDIGSRTLSLEGQAAQLEVVLRELGIGRFVGVGAQAGANVWLRYACNRGNDAREKQRSGESSSSSSSSSSNGNSSGGSGNSSSREESSSGQSSLAGLILLNPSCAPPRRREHNVWKYWAARRWLGSWVGGVGGQGDNNSLETIVAYTYPLAARAGTGRHLSPDAKCARAYRRGLSHMKVVNLVKLYEAWRERDGIGEERLKGLARLQAPVTILQPEEEADGGRGAGMMSACFAGLMDLDEEWQATTVYEKLLGAHVKVSWKEVGGGAEGGVAAGVEPGVARGLLTETVPVGVAAQVKAFLSGVV